jgi:hypothetical protein
MEPLEPHSGRRRIGLIARMRDAAVDIRPLRESRDYRRLYLGTAVSFIGSQITFVAVPFQVFDLTGSSVAVGIIGLCELVPIAGLSLIGGAIADAVDRRRLLLVTETGLALCSVLLAVNSLARPPRIWVIYVLVSISAGLFAIGLPAIRSAAPRLLPQDQLAAAAALASIYGNVGFIAGPLIAGLTRRGRSPVGVLGGCGNLHSVNSCGSSGCPDPTASGCRESRPESGTRGDQIPARPQSPAGLVRH